MPRSAVLIALVALLACGCGGQARSTRTHHAVAPSAPVATHVRVPEACTDVWVGPRRGGLWGDASNWSARRVPGPRDQACLDRGTSVLAHGGDYSTGSLIVGGVLTISGARLRVLDPSWRVEIGGLRLFDGALFTAGPVEITQRVMGTHGDVDFRHGLFIGPAADVIGRATVTLDPARPGASSPSPSPSATACGPHSPPALQACAGDETPLSREVRASWRRFSRLATDEPGPARDRATAMLADATCDTAGPEADARAACPLVIDTVARYARPISPEISSLVVVGDRAYGYVARLEAVRFVKRRGTWRITRLLRFGTG